jgi:hypothetical protein
MEHNVGTVIQVSQLITQLGNHVKEFVKILIVLIVLILHHFVNHAWMDIL